MIVASGPVALPGVIDTDPAARFAFSDVGDGNMSLTVGPGDAGARARLAAAVGAGADALVFMQQVHGPEVAVVGPADRGRGVRAHGDGVPDVDALVTFDVDVALAVLVADCVPVVLSDPHRAVAVAHAGRGGVVTGVVPATLAAIAAPDPGRMRAVVGPSIGGCCYEVPAALVEQVTAVVPQAHATTTWGTAALDLPAAVTAQLHAAGITDVRRLGGCTRCDGTRWFSHRRAPGQGRQAGVVVRASTQGDGERQRAGGWGSAGDGERQRAGGWGSAGDGERQRAGGWGSAGDGERQRVGGWGRAGGERHGSG